MGLNLGNLLSYTPVTGFGLLTGDEPFGGNLGGLGINNPFKKPEIPKSPYEAAMADIAMRTFAETDPLRKQLLGMYGDIFSGDFSYEDSPMFAPLFAGGKKTIEDQYNIARGNVLSDMPRGGTMEKGLMDVEMGRAEAAADLPTMLAQGIMSQLIGQAQPSAFGAPATAISGLGSANASASNREIAAQQTQQQSMQGLGQLLVLLALA